jgi:hypothetical protein
MSQSHLDFTETDFVLGLQRGAHLKSGLVQPLSALLTYDFCEIYRSGNPHPNIQFNSEDPQILTNRFSPAVIVLDENHPSSAVPSDLCAHLWYREGLLVTTPNLISVKIDAVDGSYEYGINPDGGIREAVFLGNSDPQISVRYQLDQYQSSTLEYERGEITERVGYNQKGSVTSFLRSESPMNSTAFTYNSRGEYFDDNQKLHSIVSHAFFIHEHGEHNRYIEGKYFIHGQEVPAIQFQRVSNLLRDTSDEVFQRAFESSFQQSLSGVSSGDLERLIATEYPYLTDTEIHDISERSLARKSELMPLGLSF